MSTNIQNGSLTIQGGIRKHVRIRNGHADLGGPSTTRTWTRVFGYSVGIALILGWWFRDEEYLTAKEGMGYALGVAGAVMMLLQFAYPLRKNVRIMNSWGSVRLWFRLHKMLGILGPILVLYHSNFRLHATN
ncbi:MAG: hypothetical protein H6R26_1820, partial [Proteobacteria bacterium]|nr:hypothetical protein [Pseudomonadota bacterium]